MLKGELSIEICYLKSTGAQETSTDTLVLSLAAREPGQPDSPALPCGVPAPHCKCHSLSTGCMSQSSPIPAGISVCPWTCPPVLSFHLRSPVTTRAPRGNLTPGTQLSCWAVSPRRGRRGQGPCTPSLAQGRALEHIPRTPVSPR